MRDDGILTNFSVTKAGMVKLNIGSGRHLMKVFH